MELVKPWNDGGSLSVTYEGSGDGSAVFSSDAYEGIDREMEVSFVGGGMTQTRKVRQKGIRQPIAPWLKSELIWLKRIALSKATLTVFFGRGIHSQSSVATKSSKNWHC